MILASQFSLSYSKPQSSQTQSIFGDNFEFPSGNFHSKFENVDFDNFEFMPEFDFDGFFTKIDSPTKSIQEPGKLIFASFF